MRVRGLSASTAGVRDGPVRRYLRQDAGGGSGCGRPHSSGVRGRRPHGARPSDGRGCPGPPTGPRVIHLRRAVECPSSVHGGPRWPPSGSGTASCDKDSHGGGGGGSTGSAEVVRAGTHWTRSRWDSRTVVAAKKESLWHPFPLI